MFVWCLKVNEWSQQCCQVCMWLAYNIVNRVNMLMLLHYFFCDGRYFKLYVQFTSSLATSMLLMLVAWGHGELPPVPKIDANAAEILAPCLQATHILQVKKYHNYLSMMYPFLRMFISWLIHQKQIQCQGEAKILLACRFPLDMITFSAEASEFARMLPL
jgi:hypothetical protein